VVNESRTLENGDTNDDNNVFLDTLFHADKRVIPNNSIVDHVPARIIIYCTENSEQATQYSYGAGTSVDIAHTVQPNIEPTPTNPLPDADGAKKTGNKRYRTIQPKPAKPTFQDMAKRRKLAQTEADAEMNDVTDAPDDSVSLNFGFFDIAL
jgi:hypothetical protein